MQALMTLKKNKNKINLESVFENWNKMTMYATREKLKIW